MISMRFHDFALFSTLYPEGMKFFKPWYDSVLRQSSSDFDLWIGCDRISECEISARAGVRPAATMIESKSGESPIKLRERIFREIIKDGYEAIIFVDSDDVLIPTRVEYAIRAMRRFDVYGCGMILIDGSGNRIGREFQAPETWNLSSDLVRNNIFGLSNTAYKTEMLKKSFPFQEDCVLLDWYLATLSWCNQATFYFDKTIQMEYRQYSNNVARCVPPFSHDQILAATRRVLRHYDCVLQSLCTYDRRKKDKICQAKIYVAAFYDSITMSADILSAYTTKLNELPVDHIWWSCVAHPVLEEIWRT